MSSKLHFYFTSFIALFLAWVIIAPLGAALIGEGTPANNPGARFLINTPSSLDQTMFSVMVGAAIEIDSTQVTGIVSKRSTVVAGHEQVDFTYLGDTVNRLIQLQAAMNNPNSNGYQQIAAFYTITSFEFYGTVATTTTTTTTPTTTTTTAATTTTTTTTATPLPEVRFTWAVQFSDSNSVISPTNFATTLAGALGITTSRVSVIGTPTKYNFIFSNITATFLTSATNTDPIPATLVGNLQDIMLTEPASVEKQLILAAYNVVLEQYWGVPEKAPVTPTIIVTIKGTPNANSFGLAIANAVGLATADRVIVSNLALWNSAASLWNFTFQFSVGVAPTTSFALATALQLVFFQGTANAAYNTHLASLNSPSQFFAGLGELTTTTPTTTTATTTAAPGPSNWIQFTLQAISTTPISTTTFRADLLATVPNLATNVGDPSRMVVNSTTVNAQTFQQTITVYFIANTTASEMTASQLVTQVMIVLKGSVSDYPSQAIFFGTYTILNTVYNGYDPIPETIVSLAIITDSAASPNVVTFRTAVAAALGLTPATRIVVATLVKVALSDILLKPSELSPSAPVVTTVNNPANLWNYSFQFSASTTSSPLTSSQLALQLQTLFFNALVNGNPSALYTANLAPYNSPAQYFGGALVPLTTSAPLLIKSSYFIISRSIAIQSTDFVSSLAASLGIPQSRIVIEKNQFQGSQSNISFSFTETSSYTSLSWYNLTLTLMRTMFYQNTPAYTNYLQAYEITTQYYGTEVAILTKAPPLKNPVLSVRLYVGSGAFDVQSFKTATGKALYGPNNFTAPAARIQTVALDLTSEPGYVSYNFTFADLETTIAPTTEAPVNTTTTAPTTAAPLPTSRSMVPPDMSASDLANYFFYLTNYKIDAWFITYLLSFNIISSSVLGLEFPMITSPPQGTPTITFALKMPKISVNETNTTTTAAAVANVDGGEAGSQRRIVQVNNPINTTVFAMDIALTMSLDSFRRVNILSNDINMDSGVQTVRFSLLPVANPKQLSPYDATLHMQYALAYREDPLITNVYLPLFLARYSFVSKSFGDDIPVLTDAPHPITRNPLLPPKPVFYSPYGPNSAGGRNTNGTDIGAGLDDSSNQDLIYGVVFGVLGAVILVGVGIVVVRVFIFKPDQNVAKFKYSEV